MTKAAETENLSRHQECTTPCRDRASIFSPTTKVQQQKKRNPKRCVIIHNFESIHSLYVLSLSPSLSFSDVRYHAESICRRCCLDKILGWLRYRKIQQQKIHSDGCQNYTRLSDRLFVLFNMISRQIKKKEKKNNSSN